MEIKGRELTQKLTFEEISQLNERKRELREEHETQCGGNIGVVIFVSVFCNAGRLFS